jgi:hypothetical protein
MGTSYPDSLTGQGYGKAVEAVLAANALKFRPSSRPSA